jgi:hypothetical protein
MREREIRLHSIRRRKEADFSERTPAIPPGIPTSAIATVIQNNEEGALAKGEARVIEDIQADSCRPGARCWPTRSPSVNHLSTPDRQRDDRRTPGGSSAGLAFHTQFADIAGERSSGQELTPTAVSKSSPRLGCPSLSQKLTTWLGTGRRARGDTYG